MYSKRNIRDGWLCDYFKITLPFIMNLLQVKDTELKHNEKLQTIINQNQQIWNLVPV